MQNIKRICSPYYRCNWTTSRFIFCTNTYLKQPAWDRQRYQRHKPPPNHTLPFYDEAPLDSLPKRQLVEIDKYGSLEDDIKFLRYNQERHLKNVPTQFTKLQELFHLEKNLWYHSIDVPLKYPEMLNFVQFLTRTVTQPFVPETHNCAFISDYLNYVISEELRHLNHFTINFRDQSKNGYISRCNHRRNRITTLMEAVYRGFVNTEREGQFGPLNTQVDDRATIETFFKRLVDRKLYETDERIAEGVYEQLNETRLDSENCVHYRIRSELAWQLRGPNPLKPIYSLEDPRLIDNGLVKCNYRPEDFDADLVECYNFSCLPYSQLLDFTEFARSIGGYWSRTPFWEGDPCEFGMIGVLDLARNESVQNSINLGNFSETVKDNLLSRHALAEGILTAFAWTSAQAYNQGFTLYNEITYPFFVQLLLLDETHIQLLRFQLNSLTSLWKNEDTKLPFNFAWFTPRLPLYNPHTQSDRIMVNNEVISLLKSVFCHPVETITPDYNLCPYICDGPAPRDSLIGNVCKPLIPTTEDSAKLIDKGLITEGLSESEIEALKVTGLLKVEKKKIRLYTAKRPHPNDVFFFKLTQAPELIEEAKATMPDFGGPFSKLPEQYNQKVRQYRTVKRNCQARLKVQAPPRRWR